MADTRSFKGIASVDIFQRLFADRPSVSDEQIRVLLGKHDLPAPIRIDEIGSSIVNRVYRVTCHSDDVFFVKAKVYRGGTLDAQASVTRVLARATELPVSRISIYDTDLDKIPFPCLITNPLPGMNGRAFFERAPLEEQTWLLRNLGSLIRRIHSVPVSPDATPIASTDVRDWDKDLRACLFGGSDLAESLTAAAAPQVEAVIRGLSSAEVPSQPTELVLLWGDPSLQNIMVAGEDGNLQISGIHDFEHAAYGQALHDIRHIIADFAYRKTQSCYNRPGLLEAFYDGYGRSTPTVSEAITIRLIEVAWKWRCICWFSYFWQLHKLLI